MLLNKILNGISYSTDDDCSCEISDIVYDSRKAVADTLFVCLCGARFDGHTYAESAYNNGCRCFMVERILDLPVDAIQIKSIIQGLVSLWHLLTFLIIRQKNLK